MELDDLKKDWKSVTMQTNNQNILTPQIIDQMTQKKYYSKIRKIKYPELAGGIVCLLGLSFIGLNFTKLDTPFFQAVGSITILLLVIMPSISLLSLAQFNVTHNLSKSYAEAIRQFAIHKIRFIKYQKINAFLSYILLVTIILLMPKLFFEKDIASYKLFWAFAFSFGYIFLLFFSKWVKKVYGNVLKQAEELLADVKP